MITEDLAAFVADFGISVPFRRVSTPVVTITAILDAPNSEIEAYDRSFYDEKHYAAKVRTQDAMLTAVATDTVLLQKNDIATINAVDWYITGIEPDGTGMVSIIISKHQV